MKKLPFLASFMVLATIIGLLGGCATLSKEQCLLGDWYTIGRSDGAHGYKQTRIGKHAKACAAYGVRPQIDRYNAGRKQGLETYCTPENAFQVGLSGHVYRHVCPRSVEAGFVRNYNEGKRIHDLLNRIESVQSEIDSLTDRLVDEDIDRRERRRIRQRMDRKFRELDRLQWELERTRRAYAR